MIAVVRGFGAPVMGDVVGVGPWLRLLTRARFGSAGKAFLLLCGTVIWMWGRGTGDMVLEVC